MRILIASAFALASCATVPASPPAAPAPAPAPAAPEPSALTRMLLAAGGADAASLEQIEAEMGLSDIRRQDGAGAALTYRLDSCALLLVFIADAQNVFRLAEAHASARAAGAAAPDLATCAAEAEARASN